MYTYMPIILLVDSVAVSQACFFLCSVPRAENNTGHAGRWLLRLVPPAWGSLQTLSIPQGFPWGARGGAWPTALLPVEESN